MDGKTATVVVPREAAPGKPWLWHGEFFGQSRTDDALLGRGFHIVYLAVPDQLGAPSAVAHWNRLYQELTQRHGLSLPRRPCAASAGVACTVSVGGRQSFADGLHLCGCRRL